MPKGFAAAAGLTPPSIVGNGAALWDPRPRLSMPARRRAVMPPRRDKLWTRACGGSKSFSPPHPHRPVRDGEEGRGTEGVQGEEGRAREEEVM